MGNQKHCINDLRIINEKKGNKKKEKQDNTFNMQINSVLKKQFNIKCIENNTTMSKVLKNYIEDYIKQ